MPEINERRAAREQWVEGVGYIFKKQRASLAKKVTFKQRPGERRGAVWTQKRAPRQRSSCAKALRQEDGGGGRAEGDLQGTGI